LGCRKIVKKNIFVEKFLSRNAKVESETPRFGKIQGQNCKIADAVFVGQLQFSVSPIL